MKNLTKKFLAPLILAGSILIGGCNPIYNPSPSTSSFPPSNLKYTLGNISQKNIAQGYGRPNGLSSNNNLANKTLNKSRSIGKTYTKEGVALNPITFFTVDPTFTSNDFRTPPAIYGIDESNVTTKLYEFTEEDKREFKSGTGLIYWDESGNEFIRQRGLNLETLALVDNSVLVISNVSNRLFRIFQDENGVFQKEDYFVNDELFGTTGMILEEDGNTVDLVQVPLYFTPTSESELSYSRNKRIISFKLDDLAKEIIVKSELPDISQDDFLLVPDTISKYLGAYFQFGDKLDLVKDSLGRFYVADSLDKKIYQIDNGVASVFKELDRPPTSMTINQQGDLFIIKGILLNQDKTKAFDSELTMISSDGTETSMQTFLQNFDYTQEGIRGEQVTLDGFDYIFPQQDFSSLNLSETATNVQIDCANYLGEAIDTVIVDKISFP